MSDIATTEQKPKPPMVVLRDRLVARQGELQTALPAHMSADRFVRAILTAVQINPDLLTCEPMSLWNAAMRSASDGLLPDGREAALVPFKSKVTYIPMYGGLLKKFRNSGQFKWVTAGIVYEGEHYEHFIDEAGEHFKHVPGDDVSGKKIRRVYALATTKDGGSFIADMPIADVLKRKNMSRASREDAPWKQWPDEMMKKTAIRVLSRLLPMSSDLDILIRRDEEALLGVEAVDDTRAALAERPSTQAALDHFAGDRQTADLPAEPEPDSGAPDESETDQEHPSTMSQSSSTGGAAAAEPPRDQPAAASFVDPIRAAEQRGRADRANGVSQKAVPPEWRTQDKTALAAAWIKGWQGAENE